LSRPAKPCFQRRSAFLQLGVTHTALDEIDWDNQGEDRQRLLPIEQGSSKPFTDAVRRTAALHAAGLKQAMELESAIIMRSAIVPAARARL
jgi:hypothetical protein